MSLKSFDQLLTRSEARRISKLTSPRKIQDFLDCLAYSSENIYRCPLRVLRDGVAHCFDGAIFAALALRRLGYLPLVLEMEPSERDDEHLLALYRSNSHWGAVAKSNFVGLRFREPIHRTLRELVLSYFEDFYNVAGEKTLRGYRRPLDLRVFDRLNWMIHDEALDLIARRLDEYPRFSILAPRMTKNLSKVDKRFYQAGLMGAKKSGLFKIS